jgi:hypothetical protein
MKDFPSPLAVHDRGRLSDQRLCGQVHRFDAEVRIDDEDRLRKCVKYRLQKLEGLAGHR